MANSPQKSAAGNKTAGMNSSGGGGQSGGGSTAGSTGNQGPGQAAMKYLPVHRTTPIATRDTNAHTDGQVPASPAGHPLPSANYLPPQSPASPVKIDRGGK